MKMSRTRRNELMDEYLARFGKFPPMTIEGFPSEDDLENALLTGLELTEDDIALPKGGMIS